MKLLKISDNCGYYRTAKGDYSPIDKIGKEDLLDLANRTLHEKDVSFDAYDETTIKNQAHQIIYKGIWQKLEALRKRKPGFVDDSARLFLKEYDRYRVEPDEWLDE